MSLAPKSNNWQPTATISDLKIRADILKNIRAFFAERDVLEVETPLMCHASVTDPFIESIPALYQAHPNEAPKRMYLQTSPEYAMKRLLVAGSGSIFQICKAFRQGEIGRFHNPEFTMLEWYRIDFDHMQLMLEVDALLQLILQTEAADKITYAELFKTYLDIDALQASLAVLQNCAEAHHVNIHDEITDRDTWLNLLMTHCIESQLGSERPCFIYNFPASQAALARINPNDSATSTRFEVYYRGMELANGWHELADGNEQRQRFENNNLKRKTLDLPEMPLDEFFLASLATGLPDCSGVALGVDRLVMLAMQKSQLPEILSFCIANA